MTTQANTPNRQPVTLRAASFEAFKRLPSFEALRTSALAAFDDMPFTFDEDAGAQALGLSVASLRRGLS